MSLSKRAENLLKRVNEGRYYQAYDDRTPKAMQELIDANLVTITGRATVFVACYVPTTGYTPMRHERFAADPHTGASPQERAECDCDTPDVCATQGCKA